MGILSGPGKTIVSADKDLKTVPGQHLNLETLEVEEITLEQADRTLFMQALTGDAADGYSGLKGVGPKTAEKLLGDAVTEEELWEKVAAAYTNKGSASDEALLMLRLARILRPGEYNKKTFEVKLWNPA
jgi:DNA polymerase-1